MKKTQASFIRFIEQHGTPVDGGYVTPSNVNLHVFIRGRYENITKVFLLLDYNCKPYCMFELADPNELGKYFSFEKASTISFRFKRL